MSNPVTMETTSALCCISYLMVMVSPGRALMFQLQFSLAGYWNGQPGLVMTPLEARRSSATSLQAKHTNMVLVCADILCFQFVINVMMNSPLEIPDT